MRGERPFAESRRVPGLSLARAAARLGICESYLRALELGRQPLSYGLACRMASQYGVGLAALIAAPGPAQRSVQARGVGQAPLATPSEEAGGPTERSR